MKWTTLVFSLCILICCRCTRSSGNNLLSLTYHAPDKIKDEIRPSFIHKNEANRMIKSYQKSVGFPEQDDQLRSLRFNADSLRLYLQDTSIREVNVILAHSMDYILSGREGMPPPPGQYPWTAIIAGLNVQHETVYIRIGYVMDNAAPCPQMCSVSLSSGIDVLE